MKFFEYNMFGTPRKITDKDRDVFRSMAKEFDKCDHEHISVKCWGDKISAVCQKCGEKLKNIRIPCLNYGEDERLLRKVGYSEDGYPLYVGVHNTFVL